MLVTNHVLVGAMIGKALRHRPIAAFAVGVASHFVMDACPHWAPENGAPGSKEQFLRVARCDGLVGLATMALGALLAPANARRAVFAGMLGAAVVDADKPCVHFFGHDPFPRWLQRLHSRIQREAPHRLPYEVGVAVALAIVGNAVVRRFP